MPKVAELHRAVYQAINARDLAGLREIYHTDCVYVTGDGVEQSGVDAILKAVRTFTAAFPDLAIEIRQQHEAGDDVSIVEYTFAGTHRGELEGIPATGREMKMVACSVVTLRDGRIVEERDYYDTLALMTQLGVADAG